MRKMIDEYYEFIILFIVIITNLVITSIYFIKFKTNNSITDIIIMMILLFSAFKIFIFKVDYGVIFTVILYYITFNLSENLFKYLYGAIFVILLIYLINKVIKILAVLILIFE